MAGNPLFAGTPVVPMAGVVQNPKSQNNNDLTVAPLSLTKSGSLLVDGLHSRFYQAAKRGNLFMSATAVAGVTVPAPATTLASKAGIRNPSTSTVDVELVGLGISSVTVEVALKNFAMEFQINASATGGIPTSITDLTAYSMPLSTGTATSTAKAYTAATMTNAAANPIVLPLFGNYATAVGFIPTWFSFEDKGVIFGPDTVMALTCVAALAAVQVVYVWAEWPR
jgi:cytoskeletal protein RodZ